MLEGTIHSVADASGDQALPTRPGPRRRDVLARLAAMSLAGEGRPGEGSRATGAEASAAARAWLELIDAGRPAVSWTAASPELRAVIGADDWAVALRSAREPLGRSLSRKLLGRTEVEALPGVPPGPYAVVRFETRFAARSHAVETVTAVLADDGSWQPVAYFIG